MYHMKRPRKKRSEKIGQAVFLGKKGTYSFDVYPLTAQVPDSGSVFIFSRRKVDKAGKASHAASCIGETSSTAAELKKHRRAKCIKQNAGNVLCILTEDNSKSRAAMLGDLREARTFSCVNGAFEPTMLRKPNVQPTSAKKNPAFIPAPDLPLKPVRRKRPVETVAAAEDKSNTAKPSRRTSADDSKRPGTKRRTVAARSAKPAKSARPAKPAKSRKVAAARKTANAVSARRKAAPAKAVPAKRKPAVKAAPTKRTAAGKATPAKHTSVKKASPAKRTPVKKAAATAKRGTVQKAPPAKRTTAKKAAAAKRRAAAKPGTRVQGRVDSDRGKHRLPKQTGTSRGRAKAGTAQRGGTRKKAAA